MKKPPVKLTILEEVATLTLERSEVRNAFDDKMILALTKYLYELQHNDKVKVLVLKGSNGYFSSGADIEWMRKTKSYSKEENHHDALELAKLLYTLFHFNKPTLCLVEGGAFGGALGLLTCCDIVLAETNSVFCFSEVKLGLIPAVVSPYVVRAIGERQARRYMLTAETFYADKAMRLGLVHELGDLNTLKTRLNDIIQLLKQNGQNALKATKQLFHSLEETKNDHFKMEYTAELIAQIRVSNEAQEGLSAFLEKRKPNWQES